MAFVFMAPKARAVAKSRESEEALERLQECLKQEEEEPVEILEQFWRAQAAVLILEELSEIFQAQKIPQKLLDEWRQDYMGLVNDKLKPVWDETMDLAEEVVEEAERIFAERQENIQPQNVKPLRIPISPKISPSVQQKPVFTQDKEYTLRWIKTHGAELVTNCTDEQKEAIRALTLRAVNENMSSAEFARYIRPTIGLTRPQAEANMKLYQTTKEMLQKEYPRMKPENVEKRARKAAENYAKKQIRQRAETIARTEIARAYNYAMDETVRQAIAEGRLPEMKRVWSTALDGKVCPTCQAMEGMEASMDGEFRAKQGKKLLIVSLPPAHPRCACAVKYVESGEKSGIIKPDKIIRGHSGPPKNSIPNSVIDHIGKDNTVDIRAFYDGNGLKVKDIHTTNHGNPKQHPYGENGEHVHIYAWDSEGKLKNKTVRELTSMERKENGNIL